MKKSECLSDPLGGSHVINEQKKAITIKTSSRPKEVMKKAIPNFQISDETLLKIFSFLPFCTLVKMVFLSRQWKRVSEDASLWKKMCNQDPIRKMPTNFDWKEYFCRSLKAKLEFSKDVRWNSPHVTEFVAHSDAVTVVAIDKTVFATGTMMGNEIKIWGLHGGQYLYLLAEHCDGITSLLFYKNYLISGSYDKTIKIWNYEESYSLSTKKLDFVPRCIDAQNGFIGVGLYHNTTIEFWELETGLRRVLKGHSKSVSCIKIFDNLIISGSDDCNVKLWNAKNGRCLKTLQGHQDRISYLGMYKNYIVSASADAIIKIWDDQGAVDTLRGHRRSIHKMVVQDHYIFSSDGTALKVWDIITKKKLYTFSRKNRSGSVCSFAVYGKIVACGFGDRIIMWNFTNGARIKTHRPIVKSLRGNKLSSVSVKAINEKTIIATLGYIHYVPTIDWFCTKGFGLTVLDYTKKPGGYNFIDYLE